MSCTLRGSSMRRGSWFGRCGRIRSISRTGRGPRQFYATHVENDRRVGGKWRLRLQSDGFDVGDGVLRKIDLWQGGVNREVVEPERVVYTFKWDQNPGLSENVETVCYGYV